MDTICVHLWYNVLKRHGSISISDKMSYRNVWHNPEPSGLRAEMLISLWNVASASRAAESPGKLQNFRVIKIHKRPNHDFGTLWQDKRSYAILKRTKKTISGLHFRWLRCHTQSYLIWISILKHNKNWFHGLSTMPSVRYRNKTISLCLNMNQENAYDIASNYTDYHHDKPENKARE